ISARCGERLPCGLPEVPRMGGAHRPDRPTEGHPGRCQMKWFGGTRARASFGLVAVLVTLAACGGKQRGAETVREIDRLRARFEAEPENRDVARSLAEAELFAAEGDPRRATAPLAKLESLDPTRAAVHHMLGLERM